jgi:Glycosyltransferase family 10 (fucosyltransferase) C-term
MCLADAIFPEARDVVHLEDVHEKDEAAAARVASFREDDVLIYNCGGPCPLSPTNLDQVFPGPILTINGESDPITCRIGGTGKKRSSGIVALDRIGGGHFDDVDDGSDATSSSSSSSSLKWKEASTYYAGLVLASQPQELRREFVQDRRGSGSPSAPAEHFLIYANSHCVPYREQAYRNLAAIGDVHYGGACNGQKTSWWRGTNWWWFPHAPIGHKSDDVRSSLAGWGGNRQLFRNYRFVLCMENANIPGYITEKILVAFLAHSVPIYYGTTEIFDVFNPEAFVYYDINNPQEALDRVAYLERNKTAYQQVLREPILAHGQETYDAYFSLWDDDDDDGEGRLKWAIRERIGFGRSGSDHGAARH